MDNKELGNLTLREIRAMLTTGDIVLQDLDTATVEKLMDREIDLLCIDEGDTGFISECAEVLNERETDIMSHEDFVAVVRDTLEKRVAVTPKRLGLKKALIIAAAVATLIIGGTLVASALGFNVFDYINKTAMSYDGTEFDEGDYTFFKPGEVRKYATIEEAVEKESLNVMYPASFREGGTVESVEVTNSHRGNKSIYIITNDNSVNIRIETEVVLTDGAFATEDLYMHNGISYCIYEPTEYKHGAIAYVDNCQYIIQTNEYEKLIYIIENMEEHKQ